jgi:heterotetrameric sarcosine oxidase gamma subunit
MPTFRSAVPVSPPGVGGSGLTLTDLSAVRKLLRYPDRDESGAVDVGFAARRDGTISFSVSPHEYFVLSSAKATPSSPRQEMSREVDVTHARALFRLDGTDAARTLEKVCALDFDDRFMPAGSAARTSVAKTTAEVLRLDDSSSPSYLITCSRSFGSYLFDALLDASAEFGGRSATWDGISL